MIELKVPLLAMFVILVTAACSVVSIVFILRIDYLVHGTLYGYGLQFSNEWAIPYWTDFRIVLAMTGIVVSSVVGVELYNIVGRKEKAIAEPDRNGSAEGKHWSTYKLGDGATIRVRMVLKSAKRLNKYSPDGTPLYSVATDNIVQVISVPPELKVKPELAMNPERIIV